MVILVDDRPNKKAFWFQEQFSPLFFKNLGYKVKSVSGNDAKHDVETGLWWKGARDRIDEILREVNQDRVEAYLITDMILGSKDDVKGGKLLSCNLLKKSKVEKAVVCSSEPGDETGVPEDIVERYYSTERDEESFKRIQTFFETGKKERLAQTLVAMLTQAIHYLQNLALPVQIDCENLSEDMSMVSEIWAAHFGSEKSKDAYLTNAMCFESAFGRAQGIEMAVRQAILGGSGRINNAQTLQQVGEIFCRSAKKRIATFETLVKKGRKEFDKAERLTAEPRKLLNYLRRLTEAMESVINVLRQARDEASSELQ